MARDTRPHTAAVQVALRIRPLTDQDRVQPRFASLSEDDILQAQDTSVHVIPHGKAFHFDHVFRPSCAQASIFSTVGEPLIHKFVAGYNATILAYGQTSSGKTYTMGTAAEQASSRGEEGIVPRAVSKLFTLLHGDNSSSVKVSFIEIYNEEVIDLLNPDPPTERPAISIREDPKGQIFWTGVREMAADSANDVLGLLQQGTRNRATGATDMNDKSSRSHAILTLTLQRRDGGVSGSSCGMTVTSKFHFVDLAGSERLKRTAAQGDRRKEGININGGLLALGNVISVLGSDSKQQQHVPYRDSKLTRLLQDSLGGNAATLMIACVSPAESNLAETANTLQYASRARHIKNKVQQVEEWMTTNNTELLRSMVASLLKQQQQQQQPIMADGSGGSTDTNLQQQEQQRHLMIAALQQQQESFRSQMHSCGRLYLADEQDLPSYSESDKDLFNFLQVMEPLIEGYENSMAALESQLAMVRAALNHADAELVEQQSKTEKYEIVMEEQERVIREHQEINSRQRRAAVGDMQRMRVLETQLDAAKAENQDLQQELDQMTRKYDELFQQTRCESLSSTSSGHSSDSPLTANSCEHNAKWREDRKMLYEQIRRLQSNVLAMQAQADERDRAAESRVQVLRDQLHASLRDKEVLHARLKVSTNAWRAENGMGQQNQQQQQQQQQLQQQRVDMAETTSRYVALHDQYTDLSDRMQAAVDKLRSVVQNSRKGAVLMRHMADFERQLEKHKSKVDDEMHKLEIEFDEFFQQRNTDKIVFVLGRAKQGLQDLSLSAIKLEEKVQQAELALMDRAAIPTPPTRARTAPRMPRYTSLHV